MGITALSPPILGATTNPGVGQLFLVKGQKVNNLALGAMRSLS